MQVAERPSLEQIRVFGGQRSSFAALTSDNGSKFINHTVAASKVAEAPCNDHGLAESKNGSVIRKHISYGHIASVHAEAFNQFYHERFNPYLNFHKPCGVSEIVMSKKRQSQAGICRVRHSVGGSSPGPRPGRSLKQEVTAEPFELPGRRA